MVLLETESKFTLFGIEMITESRNINIIDATHYVPMN